MCPVVTAECNNPQRVRSVTSDSVQCHGLWAARLLRPRDFPDKNTGVGCHFLLQGNLPDPGPNPHLLPWQMNSCHTFVILPPRSLIVLVKVREKPSQASRRAEDKEPFLNIPEHLVLLNKATFRRNYFTRYYWGFIWAYLNRSEGKWSDSAFSSFLRWGR